jgi:hypothetical protein
MTNSTRRLLRIPVVLALAAALGACRSDRDGADRDAANASGNTGASAAGVTQGVALTGSDAADPVLVGAGDIASCWWFGDNNTGKLLDSIPGVAREAVPVRLRFSSRNFRRIFKRFADIDQTGRTPPFPFAPVSVGVGQTASGSIALGSMAYYQVTTSGADPIIGVRFARPDQSTFTVDDNVQLSIFRLP